eukprot:2373655-Amphidinium_carterae.1
MVNAWLSCIAQDVAELGYRRGRKSVKSVLKLIKDEEFRTCEQGTREANQREVAFVSSGMVAHALLWHVLAPRQAAKVQNEALVHCALMPGRMRLGGVVVVASNAGGAWTPIGDITTTMMYIGGQAQASVLVLTCRATSHSQTDALITCTRTCAW